MLHGVIIYIFIAIIFFQHAFFVSFYVLGSISETVMLESFYQHFQAGDVTEPQIQL
jgi:hypothetical protein